MDKETTVNEVQRLVQTFCEARDWDRYHSPKELAIGIITEASELLEQFRFLDDRQIAGLFEDDVKRRKIEDELADIFFFLLRFAQRFDVDLATALNEKLAHNEIKYPIHKARGNNLKYTEF